MSDASAFGVIHKSTQNERAKKRVLTGMAAGTATGAAGAGGIYTGRNYFKLKNHLKTNWDSNENWKNRKSKQDYDYSYRDWLRNGGVKQERVWQSGSTGEKFKDAKQEERVRRMRNLANHPSSTNTPEGATARERLKKMGFSAKPAQETPGGWKLKMTRTPAPEKNIYTQKPWKHPGKMNLLRKVPKMSGFKTKLVGELVTGGALGLYGGAAAGVRYHQKKEGLGPYKKKKR